MNATKFRFHATGEEGKCNNLFVERDDIEAVAARAEEVVGGFRWRERRLRTDKNGFFTCDLSRWRTGWSSNSGINARREDGGCRTRATAENRHRAHHDIAGADTWPSIRGKQRGWDLH